MEQHLQAPHQSPQAQLTATMTNLSNFQGKFNMDKSGYDPTMPGHATHHGLVTRQQPRTVKQVGAGIGLPVAVRHEMPFNSMITNVL